MALGLAVLALPENLSLMQTLGSHPDPPNQKLHFNKLPGESCTRQSEGLRSGMHTL